MSCACTSGEGRRVHVRAMILSVALACALAPFATPAAAERALLTTEPRTDLRTGPSRAHNRITVLPPGITLWADDYEDGYYRVPLCAVLHSWVAGSHVRPLDRTVPRPATAPVRDMHLQGHDAGTVATIALPRAVPYRVRQQLQPPSLKLDLFGAKLARYGVRQFPSDRCVWAVEAQQVADGWAELTLHLTFSQQRGWRVSQQEGAMLLLVRRPYTGASLQNKVIVIDPGHGGPDSGAVGPAGVREKTVNMRIARQLAGLLTQRGAVARLLRDSDAAVGPADADKRGELEARLAASEQPDADLFLSIHNNAVGSGNPRTAFGTETYYWTAMSALPARILQNHLCGELHTRNRFISWRPFYVLRSGDVPRVLVECAFVSNPAEERRMRSDEFVTSAARALCEGLQEFFEAAAGG